MFAIRMIRDGDANAILDIDLKSFDDAWSVDKWQQVYVDSCIIIADEYSDDTPVGFLVFGREGRELQLIRLAVKDAYRLRGVSRQLIKAATTVAQNTTVISMLVPEYMLIPGHRSNLIQWALRMGFKIQTPFVPNAFMYCGEPENGVRLVVPITR